MRSQKTWINPKTILRSKARHLKIPNIIMAREIIGWAKVPDTKPDDLSSIHRLHMVKKKDFCKLSSDFCMHDVSCILMHAHIHTQNKLFKNSTCFIILFI